MPFFFVLLISSCISELFSILTCNFFFIYIYVHSRHLQFWTKDVEKDVEIPSIRIFNHDGRKENFNHGQILLENL